MSVKKFILIVISIINLIIGFCIVSLSAYLIHEYESTFSLYSYPVWFLIIGTVVSFVSIIGCVGAVCMNRLLLKIYAGINIVLFLSEFIFGIVALIHRQKTQDIFKQQIDEMFHSYENGTSTFKSHVDALQQRLHCCGVDDYTDWYKMFKRHDVSIGCCRDETEHFCNQNIQENTAQTKIYTKGCYVIVAKLFRDAVIWLGIGIFILILMQIASIVMAWFLSKDEWEMF